MYTSTDRTLELKQQVQSKEQSLQPNPKRQRIKFGKQSSSSSQEVAVGDEWTRQAQQVSTNLKTFNQFLVQIRRAYLDLGSTASSSFNHQHQRGERQLDPTKKGFEAWQGVKWLTDRERDEIDFAVKVALRKSVEKVRELEQLEKVRISQTKRSIPTPSGLSKFLGLPPPTSSSDSLNNNESLSSHRAYITLYLNELLQTVSERQRVQQETRVQRQLEKSSSLGGMGGGGALGMDRFGKDQAELAKGEYSAKRNDGGKRERSQGGGDPLRGEDVKQVGQVPSIYKPVPQFGEEDQEEEEDGLDQLMGQELTSAQIQQFELEESQLLQSTQSDLESLKLAESSLLEIASLQSQLVVHLTQQSELTDQLWQEAMEVSGRVEEGNRQLKKAKERGRDSRMWLLVFLFGSSFTLLFLDYYSS